MPESERRRSRLRGLLTFTLVAVLVMGSIVGVIFWRALNPDDRHLTEKVPVKVTSTKNAVSKGDWRKDYRVHYQYTFNGHTYADDDVVLDSSWTPGQELWACVDPGNPAQHAPMFNPGAQCGDQKLFNSPQRATKID